MQAARVIIATANYTHLTFVRQQLWRQAAVVGQHMQQRLLSSEGLSLPVAEGAPKIYPEKIQTIVSDISKLTLLEVADLNELLKKTLNISDAPVMAMGTVAPAAAQEEEEEEEAAPQRVQTSFTVKMNSFDPAKKVALIKQVKASIEGFNLVQAKKFVESCPTVVKADLPKDEAEKLMADLQGAGGECIIE